MTRIVSWNVNGLNGKIKNGLPELIDREKPEIICLQETHATEARVAELVRSIPEYHCMSTSAVTNGGRRLSCGVTTLSRKKPESVEKKFRVQDRDYSGRILITGFPEFVLFNCYFPTGTGRPAAIAEQNKALKRAFYQDCSRSLKETLDSGREVVICGDFNTARTGQDVANPKTKKSTSGFLPEDREDIEHLFSLGLIDTFRLKNNDAGQYTWWFPGCKEENLGWRIDYFLVSPGLLKMNPACRHFPDMVSHDHCPILLELGSDDV